MIEKQKRAQDISQRKAVPAMEQSSEKTILSFVPGTIVAVAGTGSRVEMNAENGALDPAPTTKALPCLKTQKNTLTGTDAVIHGSMTIGRSPSKLFVLAHRTHTHGHTEFVHEDRA